MVTVGSSNISRGGLLSFQLVSFGCVFFAASCWHGLSFRMLMSCCWYFELSTSCDYLIIQFVCHAWFLGLTNMSHCILIA